MGVLYILTEQSDSVLLWGALILQMTLSVNAKNIQKFLDLDGNHQQNQINLSLVLLSTFPEDFIKIVQSLFKLVLQTDRKNTCN